ncbi:MAG: MotA/TolQ/ExbB proton channel family protein [Desulfovibrionaceae bacterium]|nr:MotA/TolQ/ExbB proton channel family protein [Desulfovibrionaceae bacterium]
MNRKNLIGILICGAVFAGSFLLTGGLAAYWNLAAFLVVFSGLFACLFMSYPFSKIRNALSVAGNVYRSEPPTPKDIVDTLLDLAVKSKVDGLLSLEKMTERTSLSFLKNALTFLVDNYKEDEIRDVLSSEMGFFSLRRRQSERVFQTMARTAPAFGVAGSVIGLIGLLMGINDTAIILKSIPVAFISTLYGLILGNLVLAPIAENINFNTRTELLNQKLIMEGIIAIRREENPYKLERALTAFLSPCERNGQTEAVRDITRKYILRRKGPAGALESVLAEEDTPLAKVS